MQAEEFRWELGGAQIAGKRWRNGARPLLALHGWLDNAASFDELAPLLDADVVALDLPGHGLSEHRPATGTYNIWDDLPDVVRAADYLGWPEFHLLGHSRGAIMASLLTAAWPGRISSLIMLDALRPTPVPVEQSFEQLGRFLQAYTRPRNGGGVSRYETFERALEVRCQVAEMSERAARPIVERGLEQVDGAWQWRADKRLQWPSAFKLSAEHNTLLLDHLRRKAHLLLLADKGVGGMLRRGGALKELQGMNWAMLPGSHHFHMEDGAAPIAEKIAAFWQELERTQASPAAIS